MPPPPSTPTSRPPGPLPEPERLRQFHDAAGIEWTVWEVDSSHLASSPERLVYLESALVQGWLAFESASGDRRRLAPFPHGWEESTDGQLRGLLARARPV